MVLMFNCVFINIILQQVRTAKTITMVRTAREIFCWYTELYIWSSKCTIL